MNSSGTTASNYIVNEIYYDMRDQHEPYRNEHSDNSLFIGFTPSPDDREWILRPYGVSKFEVDKYRWFKDTRDLNDEMRKRPDMSVDEYIDKLASIISGNPDYQA